MINIRRKICGQSLGRSYFLLYYLNLSHNLLNPNLNSKHLLYSWEHWEHSYQENIFVAFIGVVYNRYLCIYKITRLIYYFGNGWLVVVVVVVRRGWRGGWRLMSSFESLQERGTKVEQVQIWRQWGGGAGWGGGSNFDHFVRT